ncbi:MAG: phage tail protein [Pseudonocardiales bacterium]|nr:phage tail protein [Pseudonocardiales bacterium]
MSAPTPPAANGAAPGTFVDPYRSYNFKLIVPGLDEAHFTECSAPSARIEAIEYRSGGGGQVVHKVPGRVEYDDLTLRYGLTQSRQLFDWFSSAARGAVQRQNVSIVLLDSDDATERVRWDLINAWPRAWRGSPLNASSQEIAIETLTLVFESLDRN